MIFKKPTRKITALAIVAFGFVGSIALAKFWEGDLPTFLQRKQINFVNVEAIAEQKKENGVKDTDGDGLKDWEETLWGTDINIKDTDGDGTSDGEEVENKRSPKIAGPNDKIEDPLQNKTVETSSGVSIFSNTISGKLSNSLSSTIFKFKYNADTTTLEEKQKAVDDLVKETVNAFAFKEYERKNLRLIPSDDNEGLRTYASNVAVFQIDFIVQVANNQANIINDPTLLSNLYKKLADNLYSLEVPVSISTEHLSLINNYSLASSFYAVFAKYDKDPALAISGLNKYREMEIRHIQTLSIIAEYIRKHGIIFTQNEAGGWWNNF